MDTRLTTEQQEEIDALLYRGTISGGPALIAVKRYQEYTGCGLNDAFAWSVGRKKDLVCLAPERFRPEPDYRAIGFDTLRAIPIPIVALEAEWDMDSFCEYVYINAIIERPSYNHPRFTALRLTELTSGTGDLMERATLLGNELAAEAGVRFSLNPPTDWDRPSWERTDGPET